MEAFSCKVFLDMAKKNALYLGCVFASIDLHEASPLVVIPVVCSLLVVPVLCHESAAQSAMDSVERG
jgi:hypothetical protein